jgi:hypothetical protein
MRSRLLPPSDRQGAQASPASQHPRALEANDSKHRTSESGEGTMDSTRLIEEWRRQGRVLEVEDAIALRRPRDRP